jgi:alpha 1,3-glucosidase
MRPWSLTCALVVWISCTAVSAVKSGDFKTCSQAAFCRRGRALAERARKSESWKSPYTVDPTSVHVVVSASNASLVAAVKSSIYPEINFGLELRFYKDGVVRVRMDEVGGLRKRYDEAASWALVSEPAIDREPRWTVGKHDARVVYGPKKENEVAVTFNPLSITQLRNGKPQVVLNGQGLLHMEHFREKKITESEQPTTDDAVPEGVEVVDAPQVVMKVNPASWFEGETEDGWWEESFLTWTDSKPKGWSLMPHLVGCVYHFSRP